MWDENLLVQWSVSLKTNAPFKVQAGVSAFNVADYAADSRFSVRLATVVSELTGELASVPACYGVPQYELGCWNL